MPDDITGLGKATQAVVAVITEPVKTMLGPAAEQLAGAWGDKVKHWREMRQLDLAIKTGEELKRRGIKPTAVAPSLLFPILDAGSLVDDENLKAKWVNLLVKAATPDEQEVLPAFAKILAELSPKEAEILDLMFEVAKRPDYYVHFDAATISTRLGLEEDIIAVVGDNLTRLGVWRRVAAPSDITDDSTLEKMGVRIELCEDGEIRPILTFEYSSLGIAFMKAVSGL